MNLSLDVINSLQLHINQCDHRILGPKWKLTNVTVPYSKLYYIKSGSGFLLVDGAYIHLEPGYVYLTPSGTTVSCGCTSLEKIYFHISVRAIDSEDLLGRIHGICRLPFSEDTYAALLACWNAEQYTDLIRLRSLLMETVLAFLDTFPPADFSLRQYSDTVRRALTHIHEKPRANLTAARIAELLYISESTLRKAFLAETGKNLGQYIDEAVLLKAAQLLVSESMPVHDISARLGFCDQFYFSRRFKQRYRMTPTQYRKHNQYLTNGQLKMDN